jgi:peptidoglycan/LPS O-acetylase OafA/YrhL
VTPERILPTAMASSTDVGTPSIPAIGTGDPAARGHVEALDGMRAIAVVLVLLFHLRVPGFTAGFLGVDVFFVLSGFLITGLLLAELERSQRISLPDFWARRARRLLPALVLLLVVVAIVTWATATFTQRTSVRGDLLATAGYVANWRFITTASYFADTGIDSPLQHTWSLAIEEQFYLLWPLAVSVVGMLFVRRRRAAIGLVAAVLAVLSVILLWRLWSPDSVERAYMGTDARIFEPLIGAAGAAMIASARIRRYVERGGALLVLAGIAGLLAGLVTISTSRSSYYLGGALLVSVATLAILAPLWVRRAGVIGKALSWHPVAWIGSVSYGAYLWHWPLTVWLGVRNAAGAGLVVRRVAVVGLTFACAAASYYLIERPIRRRANHPSPSVRLRRRRLALIAVPLSLLAVSGISIAATRVPPIPPHVPVLLLLGDSVPLHLSDSLDRAVAERGWRLVSSTFGGCPVTAEAPMTPEGSPFREALPCDSEVIEAQQRILREADPDLVVWWDRWSLSSFLTPEGYPVVSGTPAFWSWRKASLHRAFERLTSLGGTLVLIAVEPPGRGMRTHYCPTSACRDWLRFQTERYPDVTQRWNEILSNFAEEHPSDVRFVSVTDVICQRDVAPCDDSLPGGVLARPDGTHYEGPGEDLVIRTLLTRLEM